MIGDSLRISRRLAIDYDAVDAIQFKDWSILILENEVEIIIVGLRFRLSIDWQQKIVRLYENARGSSQLTVAEFQQEHITRTHLPSSVISATELSSDHSALIPP